MIAKSAKPKPDLFLDRQHVKDWKLGINPQPPNKQKTVGQITGEIRCCVLVIFEAQFKAQPV